MKKRGVILSKDMKDILEYEKSDDTLKFKHKSFYDYFFATYIYNLLLENYNDNSFHKILCNTLCYNGIYESLPYFINKINSTELPEQFHKSLYSAVIQIIFNGGTSFLDTSFLNSSIVRNGSILYLEANIFVNLMLIVKIVEKDSPKKLDYSLVSDQLIHELANAKQILKKIPENIFTNVLLTEENDNAEDRYYYQINSFNCISFNCNNSCIDTHSKVFFKKDIVNSLFCESFITDIRYIHHTIDNTYFSLSRIAHCWFECIAFTNVDFSSCWITYVSFAISTLKNVNFTGAVLKNVTLSQAKFENVTFKNCTLIDVTIDKENFELIKQQPQVILKNITII